MNVLILGVTGLLGQQLFSGLESKPNRIYGTIRDESLKRFFPVHSHENLIKVDNLLVLPELRSILRKLEIHTVINCMSLPNISTQTEKKINEIYAFFPHKLSELCKGMNIRVIQISSDGVFSGNKGDYSEIDKTDPVDCYGKAKLRGELYGKQEITIRTSMIGHDPIGQKGLLEWFLSQEECRLYNNAIFSGLTTNELALIIRDQILLKPHLHGLYHISSHPISKYNLLNIVADVYKTKIRIIKDESVKIDRSLSSNKFYKETGYKTPDWLDLILKMREDNFKYGKSKR